MLFKSNTEAIAPGSKRLPGASAAKPCKGSSVESRASVHQTTMCDTKTANIYMASDTNRKSRPREDGCLLLN